MRTLGIALSALALVFALQSCKEEIKNVENEEKPVDTTRTTDGRTDEKPTTDDSLKAKMDTGVVIEKKEEKAN